VYLALATFVMQDKGLWKKIKKSKIFVLSFTFTCASYSLLITLCFLEFSVIGFSVPLPDQVVIGLILMSVISLIGLFTNFVDVLREKSGIP
jgi:hypothetical protein